ncbi:MULTISPECIES: MFS transporter [unclassified Aeromicrobium]|uniref:MFS transporter n=1 Tax=unclassified Aeromicrobium TaxID=2633570 RepID=UPI00396B0296
MSTVTRERLWTGPQGAVVAGVFATAFLFAFESYAIATALPLVAADLDGLSLVGVSFAVMLAASVVTMTVSAPWCDREGPTVPLLTGVAGFVVGLVVSGTASTMEVFVVGRALQGLGSGLTTVALYVLVGQAFAEHIRPRVFVVLTSAWVLPALVGPPVAGWVAETFGWHWAVLGAIVPALLAAGLLTPALGTPGAQSDVRLSARRVGLASLGALAVLAVSVAGQRGFDGWWALLLLGLVTAVLVVPPLLPAGTWTGRRGLPTVIATRGVVSLAFFGVEAYLPLALVEHRGLTPTQGGMFLTGGAVLWFSGSWLAANVPALADKHRRVRIGTTLVAIGSLAGVLVLVEALPLTALVLLWPLAGLGMGMATSTLSVLLLETAPPGEHGAASAAMQTNDAVVQAMGLALGSAVFAALLTRSSEEAFAVVLGVAPLVALGSVVLSGRLRES